MQQQPCREVSRLQAFFLIAIQKRLPQPAQIRLLDSRHRSGRLIGYQPTQLTPRRQRLNSPPAPEGAIGEPLAQGRMQPPLRFTHNTLADASPILRLAQSKAAMQIRLARGEGP